MEANKFKLIHTYNTLVESSDATAILCPDCFNPVVPIIDPDMDDPIPALYCPHCDTVIKPGIHFWDQVKAIVLEHYEANLLQ